LGPTWEAAVKEGFIHIVENARLWPFFCHQTSQRGFQPPDWLWVSEATTKGWNALCRKGRRTAWSLADALPAQYTQG